MTERKMATWWTPTGYERHPEPQRWRVVMDSPADEKSYMDLLTRGGYSDAGGTKLDDLRSWDMQITCWTAEASDGDPAHMVVELDDGNYCHDRIWIEDVYVAAWWFEKYPALLAQQRQIEAAHAQMSLTKAVIAFVRHGHGKATIDRAGMTDLDDREDQNREHWARMQAKAPKA